MFQQALGSEARVRQRWSFVASLLLQVLAVAGLLLPPLLNTYQIDLASWSKSKFRLFAPPPPPAPVEPRLHPVVARFEADFRDPVTIPDQVALLHDIGDPLAPLLPASGHLGLPGGILHSGSGDVLGVVLPHGQGPPLPPPIRIGGRIQNARLTHKVLPEYPQDALEQHVSGVVKLEAIISTDGSVRELKLIQGHPMLAGVAMDAVAQWRYRPTRLNGKLVEVVTLIDVVFKLTIIDENELKRQIRQQRRRQNAR